MAEPGIELLHSIVIAAPIEKVWAEITKLDGTRDCVASLEVYRVADGRIVEVWNNSTYDHDHWPEFSGGVLS